MADLYERPDLPSVRDLFFSAKRRRRRPGVARLAVLLCLGGLLASPVAAVAQPAASSGPAASLLLIAVDGLDRELLYDMLEAGELPQLATLLGGSQAARGRGKRGAGRGTAFPHAHFDSNLLSSLPASPLVSWSSMLTGRDPAYHGIVGHEYFIRGDRELAAPEPLSMVDAGPVHRNYSEGYADDLLQEPTVYEQLRQRLPGLSVWVAMHPVHSGANMLVTADRSTMQAAFAPPGASADADRFARLDRTVMTNVDALLRNNAAPDILSISLPGLAQSLRNSRAGAAAAKRAYLQTVLEPLWQRLYEQLQAGNALANRYVLFASGQVLRDWPADDRHALGNVGTSGPAALLKAAGLTPRPFNQNVEDGVFFDSVLAFQGEMAQVYVADKSTCPEKKRACNWLFPARAVDVNAVAEAFHGNNRDGSLLPAMQGVLDVVLVRRHSAQGPGNDAFEVYTGDGNSQPLASYLTQNPNAGYPGLVARLNSLVAGPFGDRAGDVILLAGRDETGRYHFGQPRAVGGSGLSASQAGLPLILAHPGLTSAQLEEQTRRAIGGTGQPSLVAQLIRQLLLPSGRAATR